MLWIITGDDLNTMDAGDVKDLGITKYTDKKSLFSSIQQFGGLHKETLNFIKKIGRLRAANLNVQPTVSIKYCFNVISSNLMKANAIALLNHYTIYGDYINDENH